MTAAFDFLLSIVIHGRDEPSPAIFLRKKRLREEKCFIILLERGSMKCFRRRFSHRSILVVNHRPQMASGDIYRRLMPRNDLRRRCGAFTVHAEEEARKPHSSSFQPASKGYLDQIGMGTQRVPSSIRNSCLGWCHVETSYLRLIYYQDMGKGIL